MSTVTIPTYDQFIEFLQTRSELKEKTIYKLEYYENRNNYFGCNLNGVAFKGNLWRSLLMWDEYLKKKCDRNVDFLRTQYSIVEDMFDIGEYKDVRTNKVASKYSDIYRLKEKGYDENMFVFLCCFVDSLFDNDTLWMKKAKVYWSIAYVLLREHILKMN